MLSTFNVGLLRLLGALAPAAVLVASAGVFMCISWMQAPLKDSVQPYFFLVLFAFSAVYPIVTVRDHPTVSRFSAKI
ncbi:hypothetical protein Nepgr_032278 [Nepenthes gracilis]|uniref:Uncharacterized protein n=1 Tax=Nepenthes gracilis TaxID=150966 RepID=A0AAD3Y7J6_NEPGR|nr:hypothetical protein Nepgr_032278 [Nepenthes gracilis]